MGLLDDAIREHLDLKRRRGADPAEVEQAEREALGPVRREPFEDGDEELTPAAEREPAYDREDAVYDDEYHEDELEEEPLGDVDEPLPADAAEPSSREPLRAGADEPSLRDSLPAEDPVPGVYPAEEPIPAPHPAGAPLGDETVEYDIEEAFDEESVEPLEPSGAAETEPPRGPAAEPAEVLEPEPAEPHPARDEDMLEETPEFLQDTPDHDRLWFEQRPPKDFDFDG